MKFLYFFIFVGSTEAVGEVLKKLKYLLFDGNVYCLKKKHMYYAQVQLGMALLNLQTCYFVVFCSTDQSMAIIETKYDHDFVKYLLFIVKEKFFKYMLHEICKKNNKDCKKYVLDYFYYNITTLLFSNNFIRPCEVQFKTVEVQC